jgi:4-amino-4-deoxy-L-arabinose transferase-like glycosyltransferase
MLAAAILLFLPLFFLGTRTSHDWGDDFAQYIHQAKNLCEGIPQSQTGFIYSQVNYIGPQAYPVGFPLLLAPVYALFGNSMPAFTGFVSLFYLAAGLLMLILFSRYFSLLSSLLLAAVFLYNPQMIIFKREVMSDLPFTVMLLLNLIVYLRFREKGIYSFLGQALLTGLMLIIRPAGIVFVAAMLADQVVMLFRKQQNIRSVFPRLLMLAVIPAFLYFAVNTLIFKIPSGGSLRDYLLFYYSGDFVRIIPENFAHHLEVFRYLYVPQAGVLSGFALLLGAGMLSLTLLGFLNRLRQGPDVIDWTFIFYVIMLLVFPNNASAFRLMVPLGFIFLYYAALGMKRIKLPPSFSAFRLQLGTAILFLILFLPGIISIAASSGNTLAGPQQKSAGEAFAYISKNTPENAVIVFAKPRALALYTNRNGLADPFSADPTVMFNEITASRATHLMVHTELTQENMNRLVRIMKDRLTRIWGNSEFTLYKINPPLPSERR